MVITEKKGDKKVSKKIKDPVPVDLSALQAETPLGLVNEVLFKGKFAPAPKKPVAKDETVIGELTLFEKAIYTAVRIITDTNNTMIETAS